MKKYGLLLVVVVAVLALSACSAQATGFVELPEKIQTWIVAGCVFAVGWVFAQIGHALPWFTKLFGQYVDEIAFALSGAVIGLLQEWLNLIPPAWEGVGNMALMLIVAVLAALQLFRLFGKAGVKSFR